MIKKQLTLEESKEQLKFYLSVSDNITCGYCGLRSGDNPKMVFHIDHIWPKYHDGTDDPENLVDACFRCNMRKKDQRGWKTLDGRTGVSKYMKYIDGVKYHITRGYSEEKEEWN